MKTKLMALVWLTATVLSAQETVTLTVDEAVEAALANSYAVKSGAVDLGTAKRNAQTAAAATLLPGVTVSATAALSNEVNAQAKPALTALGGAKELDQWTMVVPGVSASWNFSVAMIDRIQAAHLSYAAGQITWEQTLRETELNVRTLFYNLLLLEETVDVQRTALNNARERMIQGETNFRNGRVSELSYLQTRVVYENQRPSVLQLEQSLAHSLDTFAFLLGMEAGTKITLEGTIEPHFRELDAESLIDQYLTQRFDYIALDANAKVLRKNLAALNHASFLPALSVQWQLQPIQSLSGKTAYADTVKGENGSLSLTLAWNLTDMLPFSSNRQQAADLKAGIAKLEISRAQVLEAGKNDIRAKVDTLALSRSNLAALEANAALARSAYTMTAAAYQNGATELLNLRDAETSLIQARLGLAQERVNYITGALELEYALNTRWE